MSEIQTIAPPAPRACSRCPWRLGNQGTPHPHGFYAVANLRRLWTGLKDGERMTCHPTDPRMCEFEGYEHLDGKPVTRECVGSLTLIQRELHLFAGACRDSEAAGERAGGLKRYRAQRKGHPALTRQGLQAHGLSLAASADIPLLGVRAMRGLTLGQLNDQDVGYRPLGEWTPIDRFFTDSERAAA